MRRWTIAIGSLAAMAVLAPRPSNACSPGWDRYSNDSVNAVNRTALPENAVVFVKIASFFPIDGAGTAVANVITATSTVPTTLVRPYTFRDSLARVDLGRLPVGAVVDLDPRIPSLEVPPITFDVAPGLDLVRPELAEPMTFEVVQHLRGSGSDCLPDGDVVRARASFAPARDDRGVAAYVLKQLADDGSEPTVVASDVAHPGLDHFDLIMAASPRRDVCTFLVALDVAGNESVATEAQCIDTVDGCTCTSRGTGSLVLAPLVLLLALRRRRVSIALSAAALLVACGDGARVLPIQSSPHLVVAPSTAYVALGETMTLVASDPAATWTSADDTIASVDASGVVTGRRVGRTAITAHAGGETVRAIVNVTITYEHVTVGLDRRCARTADDAIYCWGNGALVATSTPALLATELAFEELAVGTARVCGPVRSGGTACFGVDPLSGQTGVTVVSETKLHHVSGLFESFCGLEDDGRVSCFGTNEAGQLGRGTSDPQDLTFLPAAPVVDTSTRAPARQVCAGGAYACLLAADGSVWCWGADVASGVGLHTTPVPVAVPGVSFTSITCDVDVACALSTDGHEWCWGWLEGHNAGPTMVGYGEAHGALVGQGLVLTEDGTLSSTRSPRELTSSIRYREVSSAYYRACGVGVDGVVYCGDLFEAPEPVLLQR